MSTKKIVSASVNPFNIVVIVAALGYFVDIYDLILFSIVRIPSLKAVGVEGINIKDAGIHLINMQMTGMLLGGIVWGILGDKFGRLSALFLTIFLYSVANIANGFVQTLEQYSWLRLVAGFGLAGELGVGITGVGGDDEGDKGLRYQHRIRSGRGRSHTGLSGVGVGMARSLLDRRCTGTAAAGIAHLRA